MMEGWQEAGEEGVEERETTVEMEGLGAVDRREEGEEELEVEMVVAMHTAQCQRASN